MARITQPKPAFIAVQQIVIELVGLAHSLLLGSALEALANVRLVGEFDAAVPVRLGNVRPLVDDQVAISQHTFVFGMASHLCEITNV